MRFRSILALTFGALTVFAHGDKDDDDHRESGDHRKATEVAASKAIMGGGTVGNGVTLRWNVRQTVGTQATGLKAPVNESC